jgi:hypothetical protein
VFEIALTPAPAHTSSQVATQDGCVYTGTRWETAWTVRDMTADEVANRNAGQAASVRAERNDKLASTDWTQLADSTADKAAWAEYRQALRDITVQAGFPWTIDWPTQP